MLCIITVVGVCVNVLPHLSLSYVCVCVCVRAGTAFRFTCIFVFLYILLPVSLSCFCFTKCIVTVFFFLPSVRAEKPMHFVSVCTASVHVCACALIQCCLVLSECVTLYCVVDICLSH